MGRRIVLGIVILAGGWVVGSTVPTPPAAAQVGRSVAIPGASSLVEALHERSPYPVVLPPFATSGSTIENVMWTEVISGEFSFDLWYRTPAGDRIHIWESNVADLREKDPTVGGWSLTISGHQWNLLDLPGDAVADFSLATRMKNGVLTSLDTERDQSVLVEAAAQFVIP